jgi:4-diphosphocytidyl-2-C-methyl-D-erythritol kinase
LTLVVPARAKLNLDLAVLKRTNDGFHEIRTHIQAVALHDLLHLTPGGRTGRTTMTTTGHHVPQTGENSVLKAHAALQKEAGRDLPTHFHLDKRIPPGSGMGGASSDAAAALRGLAAIHNLNKIDLPRIAAQIGADVSFFLKGGAARAEGRGERLTSLPTEAEPKPQAWFAIAWPGIELLTADVYRAWDEVKGEPPNHLRRAAVHVEPRLQDFAAQLGENWQMTGSGSAFFLRCSDEHAAQDAIANLDCWTTVTHAVGPWA